MSINIVPHTQTVTNTITSVSIYNVNVTLYQTASAQVNCYDASNQLVKSCVVYLTSDQYNAWVSDDDFVNSILLNLGFMRQQ